MIIVTGGAGFIGSNIVHELNLNGISDILVVDNLSSASKFRNLEGAKFVDYMDKCEFRRALNSNSLGIRSLQAILHQGACSNTLEDDGVYMMDNNFTFSKELLAHAVDDSVPFVYASTAAVYGLSGVGNFTPTHENERPLNIYGFSKLVFDNYVRNLVSQRQISSTVVGLRYFNAYGPRELHKGRMASVVHHFTKQIREKHKVQLFKGSGGYSDGEQRRDFVFVRDLAKVNLHFAGLGAHAHKGKPALQLIVNTGSGVSRSFNDVAKALMSVHGNVPLEYVPFPSDLSARYQHYTQADLDGLRRAGCDLQFTDLETGIRETFETLDALAIALGS